VISVRSVEHSRRRFSSSDSPLFQAAQLPPRPQHRRPRLVGELVHARDRFVLECRVGAQLKQESTREADVSRDAGADGAQGDATMETRMLSLVDRPEAVGVELAQKAIAAYFLMTVGLVLVARAVRVRGFLSHES